MTKEDYDFQKHYAGVNLHQARVFRLQGHSSSFWLNIAIEATRKCLNWQPPKPQQADLFGGRL